MEEYACMIPRDTYEGAFYRAVLALHMDQFQLAQQVCNMECCCSNHYCTTINFIIL